MKNGFKFIIILYLLLVFSCKGNVYEYKVEESSANPALTFHRGRYNPDPSYIDISYGNGNTCYIEDKAAMDSSSINRVIIKPFKQTRTPLRERLSLLIRHSGDDMITPGSDINSEVSLPSYTMVMYFTDEGAVNFERLTQELIGSPLVLLYGGKVLLCATVSERISGGTCILHSNLSLKELQDIAEKITDQF